MTDKYRIDETKLQYHPYKVLQTLDAQNNWMIAQSTYPIYVEVSPHSACNHACSFCAMDYMQKEKNKLDINAYMNAIKEMGRCGVKSVMFAGEGEPLLHKDISQMVKVTKDSGIDVAFTTNGVPMTQKFIQESLDKISWIKVSFNAGTPQTYAKVHKTNEKDFYTVFSNIRYALAYRSAEGLDCSIGMQMVLLPENENEIEDFVLLAKSLECDYAVIKPYSQHKYSITHEYENVKYQQHLELEEKLKKYNTDNFQVVFRANAIQEKEPYNKCMSVPNLWAYISSNGDISACSAYLGQDKFTLGNINTQTFTEIWHGEKRKKLFEEGIDIYGCRDNCRMDACNRYLLAIENQSVKHINFI